MDLIPILVIGGLVTAWIFTLAAWGGAKDRLRVVQKDRDALHDSLKQSGDARRTLQSERDKLKKRLGEATRELSQAARVSAKCEAIVEPNKRGTFYWHIDFEGKTRASSTHKTFKTPAEPRMLLESMFPGIKVKVKK